MFVMCMDLGHPHLMRGYESERRSVEIKAIRIGDYLCMQKELVGDKNRGPYTEQTEKTTNRPHLSQQVRGKRQ